MARTATAEKTADALYDGLSMDEQAVWDTIASSGFQPVQNGNSWVAEPINGTDDERENRRIGPFPTLAALEEAVFESTNRVEIAEIDLSDETDGDGFRLEGEAPATKTHKVKQPLLPNTQNAVLEDLRSAILGYRATTMEIISLQSQQKDEKKNVLALMHKFEDELSVDRETGEKFFQVETVRCYLEVTTKETVRTEAVSNS